MLLVSEAQRNINVIEQMQINHLKIASLNVNGLNNPIKRDKVLTKFRKEKTQIIYPQETHLSSQEHQKLKKLGFRNTYYRSFKGASKRGGHSDQVCRRSSSKCVACPILVISCHQEGAL